MEARGGGSLVILTGAGVVMAGLLIYAGALLSWFGQLAGDLNFGSRRTRVSILHTSMLIVSLVLSLVTYLPRRFF